MVSPERIRNRNGSHEVTTTAKQAVSMSKRKETNEYEHLGTGLVVHFCLLCEDRDYERNSNEANWLCT